MRIAAILSILMIISASNVVAEDRPEVSKYAKVFKSHGQAADLTITMVRMGPKENNEYIIQFSGIDSDWDGKIMKHKVKVWGMNQDKIDCCTDQIRGDKYCSLIGRGGWFGQYFEAYLPDISPNPMHVYFDKEGSKQVKTEHFLTKFLKQQEVSGKKKTKK